MLTKFKDWGAGKAAEVWLRGQIEKYAVLRELTLNSGEKTISVVLHLKGEAEPLELRVDQYQISTEGPKFFVTVSHFHCPREWIRLVAIDHVIGQPFEIPGLVAKMLK
jgi:hypothetical protein